ncbi:heparinase II/III family protein [Geminisphaera colitermitum]|uniref:heparinase II/III family protein n=1 Tax=Geminisphaera colitermitum TaxID=1148786 RepID=UPI000158D5BB|nr:heparinase II/III family protein [Geminisphaera colitermitum]
MADECAAQPVPELTEELYNQFQRTGQRTGFEKPFAARTERLGVFLYAEGLRDDGRLLPVIERELAALLDEPAWSVPAHAHGRKTWNAARDNVELAAAARAWSIATADYLLGGRLAPATRARIRAEVRARVMDPILARLRPNGKTPFGWMNADNNWNAICNAGVLGSVLALSDDPGERATFIAAFENSTRFFIDGYTDDGFCQEGLGYWSYGFGHYVLGAELIRIATGGATDLLAAPKVARIAAFSQRWEITGGIYAAFGDSGINQKTPRLLRDFAAQRYRLAGESGSDAGAASFSHLHPLGAQLYKTPFDLALSRPPPSASARPESAATLPLRDWFPDGGALVVRNAPAATGLAAAFKGGHNGQPHNHNDLGSYTLVYNGGLALADLGMERYTKDSFGPKRYTAGLMNSFGHPVPRVAGKLQRTGPDARAVTLRSEFSDTRDLWKIDLTSAYAPDVPELKRITRTFVFTRSDARAPGGILEIIDRATFTTPQTFGTAIILRPRQKHHTSVAPAADAGSANVVTLRVYHGDQSVQVALNTDADTGLTQTEEPIYGIDSSRPPVGIRLGFDLCQPVVEAAIYTRITP